MFVGSKRGDLRIGAVKSYFNDKREKQSVGFPILVGGKQVSFNELPEEAVRDFREYAIPTIEIDLDDDTTLDEVINLFVDINQQGAKVKRFDVIKAIGQENELLLSVLSLIATKQTRKQDIFMKKKHTDFTRVLEILQTVQNAENANQKIDRMWERLVELVLFCRTGKHRTPGQILKSFIRSTNVDERTKIKKEELKQLRACFELCAEVGDGVKG